MGRPSAAARGRSTAAATGVTLRPANQSRRAGTQPFQGREEAPEKARQRAADQRVQAVDDVRIREVVEVGAGAAIVEAVDDEVARPQDIEHRPLVALVWRHVLVDGGAESR